MYNTVGYVCFAWTSRPGLRALTPMESDNMNRKPIFLISLALSLFLASLLLAGGTTASEPTLRITIDPQTGPPGTAISVNGEGAQTDKPVKVAFVTSAEGGTSLAEVEVTPQADGTFTADVVSGGHVTADNVPAGLKAAFVRDSDTQITMTLTGNADSHNDGDRVGNLTVTFADEAFTGGLRKFRCLSRIASSPTFKVIFRFGISMVMASPSSTIARGPPSAASGEMWPTKQPLLVPEKRPSVISAVLVASPRP